eukprot:12818246-Alexandrium_andersonii.AAC.1
MRNLRPQRLSDRLNSTTDGQSTVLARPYFGVRSFQLNTVTQLSNPFRPLPASGSSPNRLLPLPVSCLSRLHPTEVVVYRKSAGCGKEHVTLASRFRR